MMKRFDPTTLVKTCFASVLLMAMSGYGFASSDRGSAPSSVIRTLPYPFHHVVSFSDDTDELKPWHEAAIHRVFNEELGLPITDSIWPHGSDRLSTLFLGPGIRNHTPSGIDEQPTYALLLREWHRGNIDQFHGWNEDSTYQLRNDFIPSIKLSSSTVIIPLPETDPAVADQQRQNIRLYFAGVLPADLSIMLRDTLGQTFTFNVNDIAHATKSRASKDDRFVDLVIPRVSAQSLAFPVNLGRLSEIELHAPSCDAGCDTRLTRIMRDDFSRRTVLSESPELEMWNIRPALLTSHGGNTLNQDFGVAGRSLEVPRTPGTLFANASIVVRREAQADDRLSHAFHADIVKSLGIEGIWAYFPERQSDYFGPLSVNANEPMAPLTSSFKGFFNIPRTHPGEFDRSSPEVFAHDVEKIVPHLSFADRLDLYCGVNCDSAQGDALALLVATSVDKITHGESVRHFWYTHFGSRGSTFDHTIKNPLTPVTMKWMERLTNLVYNFDGKVPEEHRVWSPPASTWVRYQIMQSHIAEHLHVSGDGNIITIDPWIEPVTGHVVPDLNAGTRDLHGLTLYVPDPSKARVFVGTREITTFTRNAPDSSYRPSITLVDDHAPTAIIDRVAFRHKGSVADEAGDFQEIPAATMNASTSEIIALTADDTGNAEITFQPSGIAFWNTSHIAFTVRKLAAQVKGTSKDGSVEIDFFMKNGDTISINETDTPENEILPSSQWSIPSLAADGQWRAETLSTAMLTWPNNSFGKTDHRRPPLPIGDVRAVRIALSNASPGTRLEMQSLRALRADPNGEAPDGSHLVFGRVTEEGRKGLAGIRMKVATEHLGTLKVTTDSEGYFMIPALPAHDIISVNALIDGRVCAPQRGRQIEITKNEAEIDIRSDLCRQIISATEAERDRISIE